MEMLIGGRWQPAASGRAEEVTSPFDGAVIGTVPVAGAGDVRAALDRAESGAVTWRRTPAFERMRILLRAAALADERAGQTAQIISAEAGKAITEARGEAARSGDLIRLAAFEGTQLYGDALPLDATRGPAWTSWGSPSASRPASWWRSPRSTIPRCWSCTSWRPRWRRATRWCSSRRRPGHPRDRRGHRCPGPVVIVVPVIPHADLPGAGVWWDVAPAEVSTLGITAGLRAEYDGDVKGQRWFG